MNPTHEFIQDQLFMLSTTITNPPVTKSRGWNGDVSYFKLSNKSMTFTSNSWDFVSKTRDWFIPQSRSRSRDMSYVNCEWEILTRFLLVKMGI